MDTPLPAIDQLRQRGILLIALLGWVSLAVLLAIDLLVAAGSFGTVLAIGIATNAGPTLMAVRRRYDAEARTIAGTLAAVLPALLVFVLRGHAWQMDAHMYFFVALAALSMLCDWRPIVVASGLIAAHHLILDVAAPAWVFRGEGDLQRVVFHAVAVVLQAGTLIVVTRRLGALLQAQDGTVSESLRLVQVANTERARAGEALDRAQQADLARVRERDRREHAEAHMAEQRREELLALAADFETGVATVARAIDTAAQQLDDSATLLDDLAGSAGREANAAAGGAFDTTQCVRDVAEAIRSLSGSIGVISGAALDQTHLTSAAERHGEQGEATLRELDRHAAEIDGFVEEIRGIAAKTNLLALNATIEAARAGEAGRGFVVVAGEVKSLAGDAARASDRVSGLLSGIRERVGRASADMAQAGRAIRDISAAASGIADAVSDQRSFSGQVETSAGKAADGVDHVEQQIGRVASSIIAAASLSAQVRHSASSLSAGVQQLRRSTEAFVTHLRQKEAA